MMLSSFKTSCQRSSMIHLSLLNIFVVTEAEDMKTLKKTKKKEDKINEASKTRELRKKEKLRNKTKEKIKDRVM